MPGLRQRPGGRHRAAAGGAASRGHAWCSPPTATSRCGRSPPRPWPATAYAVLLAPDRRAVPVLRRGPAGAAGDAGEPGTGRGRPAGAGRRGPRRPGPCWRWTTPPPRRSGSVRWTSARTWWSPPAPRRSPATPTCCSATSPPGRRRCWTRCTAWRTATGGGARCRSTPGWPTARWPPLDLRLGAAERQRRGARPAAGGSRRRVRAALAGTRRTIRRTRWRRRQLRRMPGMLSFDLGSAERVARFLEASRLVAAATSFGGLHTRRTGGRSGATTPRRVSSGSPAAWRTAWTCVADVAAALDAA